MFTGKEQRALEFHFPFFLSILSFLEKKLPVFPFFFFFFSCSSSFSNFGYTLVFLILKCYKYGGLKQWVYDFEIFALQGLRVYIFTSRRSMLDKLSQQVVQEELNHLRVIWSIYEVIIERSHELRNSRSRTAVKTKFCKHAALEELLFSWLINQVLVTLSSWNYLMTILTKGSFEYTKLVRPNLMRGYEIIIITHKICITR